MEKNLRFTMTYSEDFKKNVCIPYFRDIYKVNCLVLRFIKDLSCRSDAKQMGINKISLLEVIFTKLFCDELNYLIVCIITRNFGRKIFPSNGS